MCGKRSMGRSLLDRPPPPMKHSRPQDSPRGSPKTRRWQARGSSKVATASRSGPKDAGSRPDPPSRRERHRSAGFRSGGGAGIPRLHTRTIFEDADTAEPDFGTRGVYVREDQPSYPRNARGLLGESRNTVGPLHPKVGSSESRTVQEEDQRIVRAATKHLQHHPSSPTRRIRVYASRQFITQNGYTTTCPRPPPARRIGQDTFRRIRTLVDRVKADLPPYTGTGARRYTGGQTRTRSGPGSLCVASRCSLGHAEYSSSPA